MSILKLYRVEIKWACIYAAVQLLWMIFERAMGWHTTGIRHYESYVLLFILPSFLVYFLALSDKKKNFYNGKITWLQAFIAGLIMSGCVAILSPLTQYIISTYISPDYFQNAITYHVEVAQKISLELAEANFNLQNFIVKNIQGAMLHGGITAALVAMMVQR